MGKVLVTGATGFVGSWLTRKLVDLGYEVNILARSNSDLSELPVDRLRVKIGDVTDLESLEAASLGVDTIFHLAGVVGYSKAQREVMLKVNVEGTKNVIAAALKNRVQNLLYMSSVVAVGASLDGKQPLNENSPYNMSAYNLGYFETKKEAEDLVVQAAHSSELRCVILCPSTIYGPGDAKKGSRKVQLKVARGQFPFYTGGGVSIVSVKDVVAAVISAWEKGENGERYILAGENISIRKLFELIASASGVPSPRYYLPNPVVKLIGVIGDSMESLGKKGPLNSENATASVMFHWFEHEKARQKLGFQPMSAKECIQESVDWSRKHNLLNAESERV